MQHPEMSMGATYPKRRYPEGTKGFYSFPVPYIFLITLNLSCLKESAIPAPFLDSEVFPFWTAPSSELVQSRSTRYARRRIRITPVWIAQVILMTQCSSMDVTCGKRITGFLVAATIHRVVKLIRPSDHRCFLADLILVVCWPSV